MIGLQKRFVLQGDSTPQDSIEGIENLYSCGTRCKLSTDNYQSEIENVTPKEIMGKKIISVV